MNAAFRIVRHRRFIAGRQGLPVLALGILLALGACEQNPLDVLVKHVDEPVPGADQPYPNLASVPDKAPTVTPSAERTQIARTLEADNRDQTAPSDLATPPAVPMAPPPMPAPPAPLPPGFTTAQAPVKVPETVAQPIVSDPVPSDAGASDGGAPGSSAAAGPGATLAPGVPSFGAMGRPRRVAIVLFTPGSSVIDMAEIDQLKPLVTRLRTLGGALQIVGYAAGAAGDQAKDPAQLKVATFDLSLARAQATARALRRLGVSSDEMIVSAEGDSAPVIEIDGIEGVAANERVDIYLEN